MSEVGIAQGLVPGKGAVNGIPLILKDFIMRGNALEEQLNSSNRKYLPNTCITPSPPLLPPLPPPPPKPRSSQNRGWEKCKNQRHGWLKQTSLLQTQEGRCKYGFTVAVATARTRCVLAEAKQSQHVGERWPQSPATAVKLLVGDGF